MNKRGEPALILEYFLPNRLVSLLQRIHWACCLEPREFAVLRNRIRRCAFWRSCGSYLHSNAPLSRRVRTLRLRLPTQWQERFGKSVSRHWWL